MKKHSAILFTLCSVFLISHSNCKKCEDPVVAAESNYLIAGLDPATKLPNSDTTGAFAYIQGNIDGQSFCLVDGKDGVRYLDYV
jgi:hypothetical protein